MQNKEFPKRPAIAATWEQDNPVRQYVEALEGALDIVRRVLEGDTGDWLAADYGGTGYEKHPAVVAAYSILEERKNWIQA